MFLRLDQYCLQVPLNSIMFLLIHNISNSELARRIFKFHYVSINSENQDREIPNELYAFKFHYVSINSLFSIAAFFKRLYFKLHYVSINSVTFLYLHCNITSL